MKSINASELKAKLLAVLRAACGNDATLPDLSGLDEDEARALIAALAATCSVPAGSPLPDATAVPPGQPLPL